MSSRIRRLRGRLALRAALRGVPGADGLRVGAVLKAGPRAVIAEGQLDAEPVILKLHRGPKAAETARRAADELTFQSVRLWEGENRVPLPRLMEPLAGLIVMSRAPGTRFDAALAAAPEARGRLLRRAGEWLEAYCAPRREIDAFGGGFWIRKREAAMTALPEGPDRARVAGLIGRMETERARLSGSHITRARAHGDYCPINLMVAGDVLTGIDIANAHWLAVAKDIARFLVYLELLDPAGGGESFAGLAAADVDAMVSAPGLIDPAEARDVLPYFLASELAGRLMSERRFPEVMARARALADRMLG